MPVLPEVRKAVDSILGCSQYTPETLGRFAVANQPLVTILFSGLAVTDAFSEGTRQIARRAAREELFGIGDEGAHFRLSRDFFDQCVALTPTHEAATQQAVTTAYAAMGNPGALLTLLTAIETWSPDGMNEIEEAMRKMGATDFTYTQVHIEADNAVDGHAADLSAALEAEAVSRRDVGLGLNTYTQLFEAVFVA